MQVIPDYKSEQVTKIDARLTTLCFTVVCPFVRVCVSSTFVPRRGTLRPVGRRVFCYGSDIVCGPCVAVKRTYVRMNECHVTGLTVTKSMPLQANVNVRTQQLYRQRLVFSQNHHLISHRH